MQVNPETLVKESVILGKALDSMSQFTVGTKYQFNHEQYVFESSGAGGWGASFTRRFSGQTYAQLCNDLEGLAQRVATFASNLLGSVQKNATLDWYELAEELIKNIAVKLPSARVALDQLLKTYNSESEKLEQVQRSVNHFSVDSIMSDALERIRNRISEQRAALYIKEIGVRVVAQASQMCGDFERRSRTQSTMTSSQVAEAKEKNERAFEGLNLQKTNPETGLCRANRVAFANFVTNVVPDIEMRLGQQMLSHPDQPFLVIPKRGVFDKEKYELPRDLIVMRKGMYVQLPDKIIGTGVYKKVWKVARLRGNVSEEGKLYACASSKLNNPISIQVAKQDAQFSVIFSNMPGLAKCYGTWAQGHEQRTLMRYYEMGELEKADLTHVQKLFVFEDALKGLVSLHEHIGTDEHSAPVIHGDIKPQNILLTGRGKVARARGTVDKGRAISAVVIDFGLSHYQGVDQFGGTPLYWAPEILIAAFKQYEGADKDITTAVDIWALGCTMWEQFTGEKPSWMAKSVATQDPISMIEDAKKTIPEPEKGTVLHIIWKMLAYDFKKRITASEALEKLTPIFESDECIEEIT